MPSPTPPSPAAPLAAAEPAVLEVATARARPGVAADQVARALRGLQPWLARQPGYLSRHLAHDAASGVWVDTISWRSVAEAQRAMAASTDAPGMAALMDAIDEGSFQCLHATPVPLAPEP